MLKQGTLIEITAFTWGETPLKDRIIAETSISKVVAKIAGSQNKVCIEIKPLGQTNVTSLADEMIPLFVLMTIMLGGVLVPAVLLIEEKQNHTLTALIISPATLSEILISKALFGIIIGTSTAMVSLILNQSFGNNPLLLVFVLLLGLIAASVFGVLIGAVVKDMNVLLAVMKSSGLLLIAPGIIDLIPKAPQWIAKLFPTYFILNPTIQVAERGAGFMGISMNLFILIAITGILLLISAFVVERQNKKLALRS